MHIQERDLLHWIEHFYGYGSWKADTWFVALEESGGDLPQEVAEKFDYFYRVHHSSATPTLCDIRELYLNVTLHLDGPKAETYNTLFDYRFTDDCVPNTVWKNLVSFAHAYKGQPLPDWVSYQKHSFAAPELHKEALIKLYPLPSPHNHAWYYSWLDLPNVEFLKSRALYQSKVYEQRVQGILNQISIHKPELVLMYGMEQINTLKKSVQLFFSEATFKMVKAVKQHIPQHHRVELEGTTLLITTQIPALRHNRIETGFDWQAFGDAVKEK